MNANSFLNVGAVTSLLVQMDPEIAEPHVVIEDCVLATVQHRIGIRNPSNEFQVGLIPDAPVDLFCDCLWTAVLKPSRLPRPRIVPVTEMGNAIVKLGLRLTVKMSKMDHI